MSDAVEGFSVRAEGRGPAVPDLDPVSAQLIDVVARRYEAVSSDGSVAVVATGDQRLASVTVTGRDHTLPGLTRALNEAVDAGLGLAQRETVTAMAGIPGLDPSLLAALRQEEGR